jgi:hypothetical protein
LPNLVPARTRARVAAAVVAAAQAAGAEPAEDPHHHVALTVGAAWPGCYTSCRDEKPGPAFRLAYLYQLARPLSLGAEVEHARFSYGLSGAEPDRASSTLVAALVRVHPVRNAISEPYLELGVGPAIEAAPANPRGPGDTDVRLGGALALGLPFRLTPALWLGPRFGGAVTAGGRIGVSCVVSGADAVCDAYRTSHNGFLFAGIEAGLRFSPQDLLRR